MPRIRVQMPQEARTNTTRHHATSNPDLVSQPILRQRQREYSRRWRAANLQKARAAVSRWNKAHPDKVREANRRWYAKYKNTHGQAYVSPNYHYVHHRSNDLWADWMARRVEARELAQQRLAREDAWFKFNPMRDHFIVPLSCACYGK